LISLLADELTVEILEQILNDEHQIGQFALSLV